MPSQLVVRPGNSRISRVVRGVVVLGAPILLPSSSSSSKTEGENQSGSASKGIAEPLRELGVGSDVLALAWIFPLDVISECTLFAGGFVTGHA